MLVLQCYVNAYRGTIQWGNKNIRFQRADLRGHGVVQECSHAHYMLLREWGYVGCFQIPS